MLDFPPTRVENTRQLQTNNELTSEAIYHVNSNKKLETHKAEERMSRWILVTVHIDRDHASTLPQSPRGAQEVSSVIRGLREDGSPSTKPRGGRSTGLIPEQGCRRIFFFSSPFSFFFFFTGSLGRTPFSRIFTVIQAAPSPPSPLPQGGIASSISTKCFRDPLPTEVERTKSLTRINSLGEAVVLDSR